jgi:hypothetical protein
MLLIAAAVIEIFRALINPDIEDEGEYEDDFESDKLYFISYSSSSSSSFSKKQTLFGDPYLHVFI